MKPLPNPWYSRKGLWALFLITAFPIHVWTIIRILDDYAWVADRTSAWDAVGAGAYGLMYALLESAIICLLIALLGLLLPRRWEVNRRIVMLSLLYLVTALWAAGVQMYFLLGWHLPRALAQGIVSSGHPLWILYLAALLLAGVTAGLPATLVVRSERATLAIMNIIDRLSVLVSVYLLFDLLAVAIVIGRNL
jgi:hypothetical protein